MKVIRRYIWRCHMVRESTGSTMVYDLPMVLSCDSRATDVDIMDVTIEETRQISIKNNPGWTCRHYQLLHSEDETHAD